MKVVSLQCVLVPLPPLLCPGQHGGKDQGELTTTQHYPLQANIAQITQTQTNNRYNYIYDQQRFISFYFIYSIFLEEKASSNLDWFL